MATDHRMEQDSMGQVAVDAQALWGAQTQRSLRFFAISTERMPPALIHALALVKREAARVNAQLGLLDAAHARAIEWAADEVLAGLHDTAFPLSVWQTGSATQTHMNINEVLANRASELMGGGRGLARVVHPNDHVNLGQSSNDVVPTAMHVATLQAAQQSLLPALQALHRQLQQHAKAWADIVKTGRTHLQDATPITLGQVASGWAAQLVQAEHALTFSLGPMHELAIGGTAVGTGLNTHPLFGDHVAAALGVATGLPLRCAGNRFAAQAAHDAMVHAHGALKTLAIALIKIANDIRWLASGPRCGLGELRLPENEPGSSIMPGKVNPTQCEALVMLCSQVLGNDVAIGIGAAGGQFELNTAKPLIAHNMLQSLRLLTDGMRSFEQHCVRDMAPDRAHIAALLSRSLMLVTALSPHIGHDQAATIAQKAQHDGSTLREAALATQLVTAEQFDEWVRPERMV